VPVAVPAAGDAAGAGTELLGPGRASAAVPGVIPVADSEAAVGVLLVGVVVSGAAPVDPHAASSTAPMRAPTSARTGRPETRSAHRRSVILQMVTILVQRRCPPCGR
jgi:hypothetical protein